MLKKIINGIVLHCIPMQNVDFDTNLKNLDFDTTYISNINILGENKNYKSFFSLIKDGGIKLETCILGFDEKNDIKNKKFNVEIKYPIKIEYNNISEKLKKLVKIRSELD